MTNGFDIEANTIIIRQGAMDRSQDGSIAAKFLTLADASIELRPGDRIFADLEIHLGGEAIVVQPPGNGGGITLGNSESLFHSHFNIDSDSVLSLRFAENSVPGAWILRWSNPRWFGDRSAELLSLMRPDVSSGITRTG